jgi:hypothetical protein
MQRKPYWETGSRYVHQEIPFLPPLYIWRIPHGCISNQARICDIEVYADSKSSQPLLWVSKNA